MQLIPTAIGAIAATSSVPEAAAASGSAAFGWFLVALPLFGAAILLVGGRATDKFGPLLATVLSWMSFGVAAAILVQMLGQEPEARASHLALFSWISAGSLDLSAGMLMDQLSLSFVLLVTFVGSLIHVYSLGYMERDPDKRRFFAYLNLFVAAMLLLVLADSYLLLYVGWEGVGLASYLLIGFWNHNPSYASAANKAFLANRIGDYGLGLAIMLMFFTFGRVDFAGVHGAAGGANTTALTVMGLLLLLAACGKSAQFPLQSWLGDAMAGPTPVSALIHAATMVTAGVYLVVRSHPIFNLAPNAQLAVVVVGAITLTMGAIIGCAKDDIKKALAASTMSQIGYMMLAAGLGPVGYAFAIFHLITHGFFKAGMFLGAGSVMHGMNDRVDMRTFGGLSKAMKVTWGTFMLGWLAILGIPPFAGFWSKDKVIEAAFIGEGWRPWVFGLTTMLVAGLTAFYMSRLFFMTFHGERRWGKDDHPHESPATMTVPMVVLAVGSGFLGLVLSQVGFVDWLNPAVGVTSHGEDHHPVLPVAVIMLSTLALVLAGAGLAFLRYVKGRVGAPATGFAAKLARNDFFQDDVNDVALVMPGNVLVRATMLTDRGGVDRSLMGLGSMVSSASGGLRKLQNGFVRSYALSMLVGIVVLLGAVWVVQ